MFILELLLFGGGPIPTYEVVPYMVCTSWLLRGITIIIYEFAAK